MDTRADGWLRSMIGRALLFIGGLAAALYVTAGVLGSERGLDLGGNDGVRLPVIADAIDGGAYRGFCVADAVVLMEGGVVKEISEAGATNIEVGEIVERLDTQPVYGPVYRDSDGKLREGCAPGSHDTFEKIKPKE